LLGFELTEIRRGDYCIQKRRLRFTGQNILPRSVAR
jgi:hypothetical protein